MKSNLTLLFSLAILCLGIVSAEDCYCHITVAELNKLWTDNNCHKKTDQSKNPKFYGFLDYLGAKTNQIFSGDTSGFPDFQDSNCNYLFHLFKFESGQDVGTNWEGKKIRTGQYQGGGLVRWNEKNDVQFWRKKDSVGSKNGYQRTCKCLARATANCPNEQDKGDSGCWWDRNPNSL